MLYLRMKNWFIVPRNILIISLTTIGIIGFSVSNKSDSRYLFYSMVVPSLYYLIDLIFKKISIKYQNRDFYLFLRYSDDIDNHKNDISFADQFISIALLFFVAAFAVLGAVLFGKDDLYNKWFIN